MDLEKIKIGDKMFQNWEVYSNLINRIEDKKVSKQLNLLVEEQTTRILTCPASTKISHVCAFSGGLVYNSLNVLKHMKELNKIYTTECSTDDMILTSLFHDIGKIGSKDEDYYLPQKSDYYRDRGIMFELNPNLVNVPVMARTLWWLNHYKVELNENVLEALFSLYSFGVNNKASELYNVTKLSLLLQDSVRASCVKNKGKNSILEV